MLRPKPRLSTQLKSVFFLHFYILHINISYFVVLNKSRKLNISTYLLFVEFVIKNVVRYGPLPVAILLKLTNGSVSKRTFKKLLITVMHYFWVEVIS